MKFDAERLGRFKIDHEFELNRLQHRKLGRLFAFKNAPDVNTGLPIRICNAGPIAHKTTGGDEGPRLVHCGQSKPGGERHDPFALIIEERIRSHQQRSRACTRDGRKSGVEAFTIAVDCPIA